MKSIKAGSIAGIIVLVAISLGISTGGAQQQSWTYGGVEYRLPKPVDQIQLPSNLPEFHVVVSGDCLWNISAQYLTDAFLWPLIWEQNLDSIQNPHLIFPDQQVKLPGGTLITPTDQSGTAQIQPSGEPSEPEAEISDPVFSAQRGERKPFAVTSETAIISSGYISKDKITGPKVIGAETESFDLSTHDIVIIDGGRNAGIEPEKEFYVLRMQHKVYHPITGKFLGNMYHIMGEVKALCVQEDMASAVVRRAYHAILRDDFLVPREEIPIPLTLGSPPVDPCNPSSKKYPATIVDAFVGGPMFSDAVVLAKGDIAYIDLGSKDGVAPGDYFTIFKRNLNDPNLPRYVSGEAMLLKAADNTSVVVITDSKTGIFLGDELELKQ